MKIKCEGEINHGTRSSDQFFKRTYFFKETYVYGNGITNLKPKYGLAHLIKQETMI